MRYKVTITFIAVCLLFLTVGLIEQLSVSTKNYTRLEESYSASQNKLINFRTLNGKQASKIKVLQLRNSELEAIYPKILNEVRNLNIKPRMVNNYTETVIHHQKEVVTNLKDSIVFDTLLERKFDYSDTYYSVEGKIQNDSIHFNINSTDSLIQVVYHGKRKHPWLWIFSSRELEQAIYSKNPNSTIIYSKTISIVK
jgi:hypothetical protein